MSVRRFGSAGPWHRRGTGGSVSLGETTVTVAAASWSTFDAEDLRFVAHDSHHVA